MSQDERYDKITPTAGDIQLGIVGPDAGTKEGVLVYVPSVADRKFRIRPFAGGGAVRLSKTKTAELGLSGCVDFKDGTGDEFRKYCAQEGISLEPDAPQTARSTAGPDLPDDERYRRVALQPADIPLGIVDADAASSLGSWAKEGVLVYAPNRAERKFLIRPSAGGGASALTKVRTAQLGESGHVDFADGTGDAFRQYCAEDNIPLSAAIAPVVTPAPAPEPEPIATVTEDAPEVAANVLEDDIDRTLSPADQSIRDMTQGQLRKLAADAGIPNRANMGKDELLVALAAAGYGAGSHMGVTSAVAEPVAIDFDTDATTTDDFIVPADEPSEDAFVGFGDSPVSFDLGAEGIEHAQGDGESFAAETAADDVPAFQGGSFSDFMPADSGFEENSGLLFNFGNADGETEPEAIAEDEGDDEQFVTIVEDDDTDVAPVTDDGMALTNPFAGMGESVFAIDDENEAADEAGNEPADPFSIEEAADETVSEVSNFETGAPANPFVEMGFDNPFTIDDDNEEPDTPAAEDDMPSANPFVTAGGLSDLFPGTDEDEASTPADPFATVDVDEPADPFAPIEETIDKVEEEIPSNPFAPVGDVETAVDTPIDFFQPETEDQQDELPVDAFSPTIGFSNPFAVDDEQPADTEEGDDAFVKIEDDESEDGASPFGFGIDGTVPEEPAETEAEVVDPLVGYEEIDRDLSSDDEYDKVAAAYVESVSDHENTGSWTKEPEADIDFPQVPGFDFSGDSPLDFDSPEATSIEDLPADDRFEAAIEEAEQVVSDMPPTSDGEGDIAWPEFGATPQVDFGAEETAFPGFDMTPADDETEAVSDSEYIFSSFDEKDDAPVGYEPAPASTDEVDEAETTVTFGPTFAEIGQSATETEPEPVDTGVADPSLADTNPIDRSHIAGAAAAAAGGIAAGFVASKLANDSDVQDAAADAVYQGEDAVRIDLLDDETAEATPEQPIRGVTPEDRKDMRGTYMKTLIAIIILLAIAGAAVAYLVHGGAPLFPPIG